MLDIAPPDFVTLAAESGFDAVGIRAAVAGATEERWPMIASSPMLTETQRRMAATGVTVLDVEVVRLTPDSNPAAYEALFDVGALLGARFVNVLPDDPDLDRLRDSFHILADKARPYGLRPTLEPTAYTSVRSLADAAFVAAGSGGGITIDPLHLHPTSCCCRNSGRWSSPAGPGSRWPGCCRREPGRHDGAPAVTLAEPPFYALEAQPAITFTAAGRVPAAGG
jgi:hypothetical protein